MSDLARFWPARLPVTLRDELLAAYAVAGARLPRPPAPDRGARARRGADLRPTTPTGTAVLLAAWFHDAVYDGQADDEERSARLAESGRSAADPLCDEVARLVRLTASHRPADDDHAGQLLCDADLGDPGRGPGTLRVVHRRRAARARPRPRRRLRRRPRRDPARPAGEADVVPHAHRTVAVGAPGPRQRHARDRAAHRFHSYGVVVDTLTRPDRSRIGRENSVESLCSRVLPIASADRARAAVTAR